MSRLTHRDLLDALRLRRWALSLFSLPAHEDPAHCWRGVPSATARSWELFVASERCALPLLARLGGADARLSAGALQALRRGGEVEGTRVLGVQGQLRRLGRMAELHGWKMVVLKSGAGLLQGRDPVDLSDLDVLVPEGCAASVEQTLIASGYRSTGMASAQHLAGLLWGGTAKVEVHVALRALHAPSALARSVRAEGDARLYVLAPADHAWHLLHHPVHTHPERRGEIRDLLQLGCALGRLDEAELGALEQRAAGEGPLAPVYLRMLRQALRMRAGTPRPDEFQREAACRLMMQRAPTPAARTQLLARWPTRPLYGFASGVAVLREEWGSALTVGSDTRYRSLAALHAWSPRVARGLWRACRVALGSLALMQARWLAARAARLVRLAG